MTSSQRGSLACWKGRAPGKVWFEGLADSSLKPSVSGSLRGSDSSSRRSGGGGGTLRSKSHQLKAFAWQSEAAFANPVEGPCALQGRMQYPGRDCTVLCSRLHRPKRFVTIRLKPSRYHSAPRALSMVRTVKVRGGRGGPSVHACAVGCSSALNRVMGTISAGTKPRKSGTSKDFLRPAPHTCTSK